jgi:hypothetical protein
MTHGPNDLARALAENQRLLDAINGDLDRLPAFKQNTTWHLDRVRERQHLLARREQLRDCQRQLAETN